MFDEVFATRTRAEWGALFDRTASCGDRCKHRRGRLRRAGRGVGAFEKVEHRSGDDVLVRTPVEFSATPPSIRRTAPELGEHTEEVLLEHGYTWEDIAALKEKGAIG